ncbi:hypothetical protein Tco_0943754 [Tanacetum coccineum]
MEPKDTLSSCSDVKEKEIQQLQMQEKILKENSMNKFNPFKTTTQRLERQTFTTCPLFQQAFAHLFSKDVRTFKFELSQNMQNLERQLNKETLHEKVSKSDLTLDASLGDKDSSGILSDKGNDQSLKNQSNTSGDESSRSRNDSMIKALLGMIQISDLLMTQNQWLRLTKICKNVIKMRATHANLICNALANLIENLTIDTEENKKILKQLKKANASLTQELKECKSNLEESNTTRDSCLIALQSKQTELETYKTLNDRTVDYDKLERKLNETLGLLAQKEIDIKEGLKLKAYEILVVKEKHDELVKHSFLTKSHYEGLVKEKTKVITDLKLKEEKDIDKMISMEKQLKFLNEIVYKRNQSIQTIHMLAPKGSTFNGRPTFANPMYLKKAQSKKPCLYEIPYDTSDLANRFVPDREETLTLKKIDQKLNNRLVKTL